MKARGLIALVILAVGCKHAEKPEPIRVVRYPTEAGMKRFKQQEHLDPYGVICSTDGESYPAWRTENGGWICIDPHLCEHSDSGRHNRREEVSHWSQCDICAVFGALCGLGLGFYYGWLFGKGKFYR